MISKYNQNCKKLTFIPNLILLVFTVSICVCFGIFIGGYPQNQIYAYSAKDFLKSQTNLDSISFSLYPQELNFEAEINPENSENDIFLSHHDKLPREDYTYYLSKTCSVIAKDKKCQVWQTNTQKNETKMIISDLRSIFVNNTSFSIDDTKTQIWFPKDKSEKEAVSKGIAFYISFYDSNNIKIHHIAFGAVSDSLSQTDQIRVIEIV